MNELEQQTRARLNRNTFMVHNFIEMEHVEPDRAVFRLDVRPESLNAYVGLVDLEPDELVKRLQAGKVYGERETFRVFSS